MNPIGTVVACVRLLAVAASVATAGVAAAQTAAAPAEVKKAAAPAARKALQPIIEERAVALLRAASDRLAAAKSMSFTAVASYEYPSRLGPPILYSVRYDVTLQRPNQLKVVIPGDGPASEFTFDGKDIVAFVPGQNLVAVAAAPPTLEGALRLAYQAGEVYFPFTDLLLPDPYAVLADGAMLAYMVGPSSIVGGTLTDIVVVVSDDIFMQLWIGRDDKLPRRIRALYRDDRRGLRHDLELSGWQIDAPVDAQTFATDRARTAQPMAFGVPGPKRPLPAAAPKRVRSASQAASAAPR